MEKAKRRESVTIFEQHHIIPKSLGGNNDKQNMVRLTPREHFIAHALLTKMCIDSKNKRSMSYAFVLMKISHNSVGYSRVGNGKLYEQIKNKVREDFLGEKNPFYGNKSMSGENNPFYGKKHTEETRKKISLANTGKTIGDKNPFYGKTHTEETKKMLSKQKKRSVSIIFLDGKVVKFDSRGDIGNYLGVSKSMGQQLCSIKKHLWTKYNIKEIIYENNID